MGNLIQGRSLTDISDQTGRGRVEEIKSIDGALYANNALNLAGNAQATLAISSTGAQTVTALASGKYAVWTTTDCYIKVATTASNVTTSTGYLVSSLSTPLFINIPDDAAYKLGAITSSASGTLSYHKVS